MGKMELFYRYFSGVNGPPMYNSFLGPPRRMQPVPTHFGFISGILWPGGVSMTFEDGWILADWYMVKQIPYCKALRSYICWNRHNGTTGKRHGVFRRPDVWPKFTDSPRRLWGDFSTVMPLGRMYSDADLMVGWLIFLYHRWTKSDGFLYGSYLYNIFLKRIFCCTGLDICVYFSFLCTLYIYTVYVLYILMYSIYIYAYDFHLSPDELA